jgi:hypothetical protein
MLHRLHARPSLSWSSIWNRKTWVWNSLVWLWTWPSAQVPRRDSLSLFQKLIVFLNTVRSLQLCVYISKRSRNFILQFFCKIRVPTSIFGTKSCFDHPVAHHLWRFFVFYSVLCLLCLRGCCCCCWWGHNKLTSVATRVSLDDGIYEQTTVIENSVQLYRQDNWVGGGIKQQ